ncbi:MAG: hypothetical protein IJN22_03955 [Clostridia bacterium]|nr:hypothetical protein [Clostridia bacterium]
MKQLIDLNGKWELYLAEHAQVKETEYEFSILNPKKLPKNIDFIKIDAEVPGNFELDMQRAGLLPEIFEGTNPLLCQHQENKHLWYVKEFTVDEIPEGDTFLRFEGIDTFADIYLNDVFIGECDNMLIEHEYSVNDFLKKGKNEIIIHIYPTTIKAREYEENAMAVCQPYNEDSLHVRKAPYMFGWDIMPRTVSGGLWRSVSLVEKQKNRIEDFYIGTANIRLDGQSAQLMGQVRIHTDDLLADAEYEAVISGNCGDSHFEQSVRFLGVTRNFNIWFGNAKYWYPKGAGEQNLYDVEVKLYRKGELCDTYKTRFGIRIIELRRTSNIDENGNGKFEFWINRKRVFIMGTNWVPLDAFPSQNEKRVIKALEMVEDIGCNMIRLWGGNIYESDIFYNWCDEHGIMLWQDFIMGCGYYPQYDEFCERLREEATVAVKRLRTHASLVLWAGDNECDSFYTYAWKNGQRLDPNTNVLTRKVLPDVLRAYDGFRPYLPSSPYIDEEAFANIDKNRPSEDHLWGPRNYFKSDYYKNATALFASETGFHGCPSPESLKKYITKDHLWPIILPNGRPDPEWIVHAASMETKHIGTYEYRIALMLRQVAVLFSDMPDGNTGRATAEESCDYFERMKAMFGDGIQAIDGIAKASQIFQAEAFKFMIERFRIRKATHGGLIWWNLVDGWPQISDAVVDYYFTKKLAYDYIKNSQQPLCLMFDEPDKNNKINLFVANEIPQDKTFNYKVTRINDGVVVCYGESTVEANGILQIDSITVDPDQKEMFLIEWECDGKTGRNHFVNNIRGIDFNTYIDFLNKTKISHFEGF